MTVQEAYEAWEHADETITGCENIGELDAASNYHVAMDGCPSHFTQDQKDLAQQIILNAFEKSIGRA